MDFFRRYENEPVSTLLALPWNTVQIVIPKNDGSKICYGEELAPADATKEVLAYWVAYAKERNLDIELYFNACKCLLSDGLTVKINEDLIVTRCVEACLGG
jgi:hypothetical protein